MKKIATLLLAILVVSFCWGQNESDDSYSFTLNGNRITPASDFSVQMKSQQLDLNFDQGATTAILQFNTIPTIEEHEKLKEEGIILMDYLQGNAYFASLTEDISNIKTRKAKNIRSLLPILPEYRISQRIANRDIPDYAKTKQGMISIVISYFDLSDEDRMLQNLKDLECTSVRIIPIFHNIRAEISQSKIELLASYSWIKSIALVEPPQTINNAKASRNHRANILNSSIRGVGYDLTGKGVKIGLWDTDAEKHLDFGDRIINREYEYHTNDHGTHTCGTIAGAGLIDPAAKGMAPEATIYTWNFKKQSNGLTVPEERLISLEEDGIELTSNSFGAVIETCPNPISYDNTDRNEDYICNLYPSFLFIYSAGNDQDLCPDGYHTTTKNIKNSLIVASIDNNEDISWFSSCGPSHDGRLIPNISGVGDWVYSTRFNNSYSIKSGTSMAAPGVAGTMALLIERYKQTHSDSKPLSSLMRALACNTATDKGNAGPDYKFGFGVINGQKAIEVLEANTYFSETISHGGVFTRNIEIPEGVAELRVMLSWTDRAGNPSLEKILVNNLDLQVIGEDSTSLPWVLDPTNPAADAVRDIDQLNNLEQVCITKPKAGTYTIKVSGTTIPNGSQEFSVVYDVINPTLKLTYPLEGDVLVPNSNVTICWNNEGYSKPFHLEYSSNNGLNYHPIAINLSPTVRTYTWQVPADSMVANAKLRVSSGSSFDETKNSFSIISTPSNLTTSQPQCGDNGAVTLSWDSVANAKYQIFKLYNQEYIYYDETVDTHFEINDLLQGSDHYFYVKAIDLMTGTTSKRSLAVVVHKPEGSITLPFEENFNDRNALNFGFNSSDGYGKASIKYVTDTNKYGIILEGTYPADDWIEASGEDCFTANPNYVIKASLCDID
ncbi:MAG: S8 family serine peptidase, partial [Bacteroidales bacterium]|nr:S8 family serine peptidase [Bacteroidales bacterium]